MGFARINAANRRIMLTNLAYDHGYTDQAHFIKDFKNFTGESPAIFVREKDRFIINPNMADLDHIEKADL